MAAINSKSELVDYCLRALGRPVINVEVAPEQASDRVDDALALFQERHYDATEEKWVYYELTQDDIDSGYINDVPENVLEVLEVMSLSTTMVGDAYDGMFSFQYQIALSTLTPWMSFNTVDYFIKMTSLREAVDMTNAIPKFEFVKHSRKIRVYKDFSGVQVGHKLALRILEIVDPEDESNTVWNNRWLKKYATALIKRQWGTNTKKFGEVQMLGGITISGQQIYDEAEQEIKDLETQLTEEYQLPVSFIVG